MNGKKLPNVIWVVGDNTHVGKTTISAALIRVFHAMGVDTIGFKPYVGARLMDVIDEASLNKVDDAAFKKLRATEAVPLVYASLLSWVNFLQGPIGKSYPLPATPASLSFTEEDVTQFN